MAEQALTQGSSGSRGICQGTNEPDANTTYAERSLPSDYFDDIGSNLSDRIKRLRLSQVEFAKAIGVTPRCVTQWVTSERKTPSYALKFAEALSEIIRLRDIVLGKRSI